MAKPTAQSIVKRVDRKAQEQATKAMSGKKIKGVPLATQK